MTDGPTHDPLGSPTLVKVCGLTEPEDAEVATHLGVDAIGVVHHEGSPRSVTAERAARVIAATHELCGGHAGAPVLPIAVMVDPRPDDALRWMERSGARALQLCGSEPAADWRDFPHPVLRRIAVEDGARRCLEEWRGIAAAFVLDHPSAPGGTGRAIDLEIAARLAASAPSLLAGGLDADNVAHRIAATRPLGVDASSRLERSPGRKDHDHLLRFVGAARAALSRFSSPRARGQPR